MENIIQQHQFVAVFIVRLFLGLVFFFQGYDTVFKVKIKNVIDTYKNSFENKGIPKFVTTFGAWYTSLTALLCGFLLIFGLFEYCTLYLLGINLVLSSIAFGINTPMWDMRFLFPRLISLIFLLVVPASWNMISLDTLLKN